MCLNGLFVQTLNRQRVNIIERNLMSVLDKVLVTQYKSLHKNKRYGTSGHEFLPHIQILIAELRPDSILNYGCGQTRLQEHLELFGAKYYRYDPAIPEISKLPVDKVDLLINTDVLEHIPEEDLNTVLSNISSISQHVFFNIATRPAVQILPNGKNAHCTIKTAMEWKWLLGVYFTDVELIFERPGHSCIFLTWHSCLKDLITFVAKFSSIKKRLKHYERPFFSRVKKRFSRLKRKLSKSR